MKFRQQVVTYISLFGILIGRSYGKAGLDIMQERQVLSIYDPSVLYSANYANEIDPIGLFSAAAEAVAVVIPLLM